MARTDKDRPLWVREADPSEDRVPYHRHQDWRGLRSYECDFEENEHARPSKSYKNNCGWSLRGYHWYTGSVPKWFIDHVYNNPERVRVRDDLRNMAREYNAYNDLEDDDFPNHQHHYGASWYWW